MENGGLPASKAYLLVIRGTHLQCWTSTVGSTLKTECQVQNILVKPLVLDVIAMRKFVLQLKPSKNSSHDLQRLRTRAKGRQPARSATFLYFSKTVLWSGFISPQLPKKQHKIKIPGLSCLTVFARGWSHYRPKPWGFKDHKTRCLLSLGL